MPTGAWAEHQFRAKLVCFHGIYMRSSQVFVTVLCMSGLALAACSSQEAAPEPSASPTVAPSESMPPSATPSPEPTPSSTQEPAREVTFAPLDPGMLGMHVAGAQEGDWPSDAVPVESLRLWDTGTSWLQIEATRGRYEWGLLDTALETAADAGVTDVLLVLGPTPVWNASSLKGVQYPVAGAASEPKSVQAWDDFVTAVVDRYAGRITAYQIWNEASLKMFWQGSPEQMADLTERAYRIIKERDPSALVVGASTTVRLLGAFERFFPAYMEELAARDWPVDVSAVHSYPSGVQGPLDRARNLRLVRHTLDRLDAPALPVWDTELNYGLAGPGDVPRGEIVGDQATSWVVRTYLDSMRFGVGRTYFYIWTPEPYELLGMQMTNDSGAAAGLRVVSDWLVGGEWGGCEVSGLVNMCVVRKDGEVSELLWADFGEGQVSGLPEGAEACTALGACQLVGEDDSIVVDDVPVRVFPARDVVDVGS